VYSLQIEQRSIALAFRCRINGADPTAVIHCRWDWPSTRSASLPPAAQRAFPISKKKISAAFASDRAARKKLITVERE